MENSHERLNGNGLAENGNNIIRHSPYQHSIRVSLPWLDLKVFYVRVSQCEINGSTPEYLTLNHIPINQDTLLDVNGVDSDGVSTLLRRDRLDKKSEEVTFVSTDRLRMTGSVKFEVFDKDVVVLSGVLELCHSNGFFGESDGHGQRWSMNCESDIFADTPSFLKGKQCVAGLDSALPTIEVYVAGSFVGNPIILTKTLQLSFRKKHMRKLMLESIPEYEASERQKDDSSGLGLQMTDYSSYRPENENEDYSNHHHSSGMDYIEGEDGELSWFNAGVRVGVGIGLSICLGIGIGVGLLVRTYQGTTRNFRRRLL